MKKIFLSITALAAALTACTSEMEHPNPENGITYYIRLEQENFLKNNQYRFSYPEEESDDPEDSIVYNREYRYDIELTTENGRTFQWNNMQYLSGNTEDHLEGWGIHLDESPFTSPITHLKVIKVADTLWHYPNQEIVPVIDQAIAGIQPPVNAPQWIDLLVEEVNHEDVTNQGTTKYYSVASGK
ncbi:hypothetical protein [Persicobacter diffluens]|uniref:Uncharacterized protein n=1 Tax=Persicobacter diffluens TaxID=981 RepID=A0AAN4W4H8_9BACT|nr:hypothetical protein PEDI_44570 [Persicobacter diffluens]